MKTLSITPLLLLFFCVRVQAQTSPVLTGHVVYKNTFTLSPGEANEWRSTLTFRGQESVVEDDLQRGKPKKEIDATHFAITPGQSKTTVYYKNKTTNLLISRQIAGPTSVMVIVDDTLRPIRWKIMPDTRQIGRFKTQKAQALVRGRQYTAWFAPAIAMSTGPWKLHGLPGLILEAEDSTGEVKFLAQSVTIPAPEPIFIKAPEPGNGEKRMNSARLKQYEQEQMATVKKMLESKPTFDDVRVQVDFGKPKSIEIDP